MIQAPAWKSCPSPSSLIGVLVFVGLVVLKVFLSTYSGICPLPNHSSSNPPCASQMSTKLQFWCSSPTWQIAFHPTSHPHSQAELFGCKKNRSYLNKLKQNKTKTRTSVKEIHRHCMETKHSWTSQNIKRHQYHHGVSASMWISQNLRTFSALQISLLGHHMQLTSNSTNHHCLTIYFGSFSRDNLNVPALFLYTSALESDASLYPNWWWPGRWGVWHQHGQPCPFLQQEPQKRFHAQRTGYGMLKHHLCWCESTSVSGFQLHECTSLLGREEGESMRKEWAGIGVHRQRCLPKTTRGRVNNWITRIIAWRPWDQCQGFRGHDQIREVRQVELVQDPHQGQRQGGSETI